MQEEGLEPTRLSTLDPKSSASANSATLAQISKNKFKRIDEALIIAQPTQSTFAKAMADKATAGSFRPYQYSL